MLIDGKIEIYFLHNGAVVIRTLDDVLYFEDGYHAAKFIEDTANGNRDEMYSGRSLGKELLSFDLDAHKTPIAHDYRIVGSQVNDGWKHGIVDPYDFTDDVRAFFAALDIKMYDD